MRRPIVIFLLICAVSAFAHPHPQEARPDLPKRSNGSFKAGEYLKFRVHYGFIDAGSAELSLLQGDKTFAGRSTLHIVGLGRTVGAFDWVFKIRDRYESYIDAESVVPWFHIRDVREGGFKHYETNSFNHYNNTVKNEKGVFDVPTGVQDLVSAYYYTRCIYTSNMTVGDLIPVKAFFDNKVEEFSVKYLGRETIKTEIGKVRCLKFCPMLATGRVFKEKEDMSIWVSDDKNYIPIRLEAKLLVGSVKADLTQYSGLANPFDAMILTK